MVGSAEMVSMTLIRENPRTRGGGRVGGWHVSLEYLPKRAVEEYKAGFEMGLVRMGQVSLEYGYQLALARLQARHPVVEIELDPFVTLPEDANVPIADEQPFDDSLPPPED
ncbi:hypothetical protein BHE74_00000395 [Ensete ventricosum]|nr:hypothetical protein BHE74_00000395 [Ensete ventricosum]